MTTKLHDFSRLLPPGFDPDDFLKHYWQRQPMLIKSATGIFSDPLTPEELAGLACEPEVESRLVETVGPSQWQLRLGPFQEDDFRNLPDTGWTVLVQAVDLWLPSVAALKTPFSFLPHWRIDDVMVSYATDASGVGPHFDYYDVFLVQGLGRRRWRLGQRCDQQTPLLTESGLKILQQFDLVDEFVLEPGDVLYVPARFAHHGKSLGDSLCYSIGFRAPSDAEMLAGFADLKSQRLAPDLRFEDSSQALPKLGNQLPLSDLQATFARLLTHCHDFQTFLEWFGCHATLPRHPELIEPSSETWTLKRLHAALTSKALIRKHPLTRIVFSLHNNMLMLFCDGISYETRLSSQAVVAKLCDAGVKGPDLRNALKGDPGLTIAVADLLNQGSLLIGFQQD